MVCGRQRLTEGEMAGSIPPTNTWADQPGTEAYLVPSMSEACVPCTVGWPTFLRTSRGPLKRAQSPAGGRVIARGVGAGDHRGWTCAMVCGRQRLTEGETAGSAPPMTWSVRSLLSGTDAV